MDFRQKRQIALEYEKVRAQFSFDFRELLRERGMDYNDVAVALGWTRAEVRRRIQGDDLTLKDIVYLAAGLQGTTRILIILPRP